jgi:hypothetical protein
MKRLRGTLVLLIFLLMSMSVSLAACGEEPTTTPVPATATPTTAAPTTLAPTNTPFNPIVQTITAGANHTGSPAAQVAPATPTIPPTFANVAPANFPIYSNLKLINLGYLGQQVADTLSQSSKTAQSSFFYTTDTYAQVSAFYNSELPTLGYTKVVEQGLPAFTSLTGKVLLYSKGTGPTSQVAGLLVLGPLDTSLISVFKTASPDAAVLKEGDSIVIILTGLTGEDLTNFQKSLEGGAVGLTPVPTR